MPSLAKLRWYWKRAKLVTGREAVHRLRSAIETRRLRRQWRSKTGLRRNDTLDPSRFKFYVSAEPQLGDIPFHWNEDAAKLEPTGDGTRLAPPFPWQWRDDTEVWHETSDSRRRWPSDFFADIEHRPGNPWGDAREVWEASRLQHLVG